MDVEFIKYKYENGHYGVITKHGFKIGIRHLQTLYMFISSVTMGVVRGSIGVAVLSMTDETRRDDTYIQIYNWDRRIQGAILSSFFCGYAILLVPSELFLKKLNAKLVVASMLIINGALCVSMPTIVSWHGWMAMLGAHFVLGMAHAPLSTANHVLIDNWIPPQEKNWISWFVYAGVQLGIIIGLPTSGLLTETRLGWELIYYTLAMITLSIGVIYVTLTANSPDSHEAAGDKEREFIKESKTFYIEKSLPKPWKSILISPRFWSVVCAHAASNALFIFFLVDMPAFFKNFMKLKDAAYYCTLPFISMWLTYITTSPTLDWISSLKMLRLISSITNYRKCINTLGALGIIIGLRLVPILALGWIQISITIISLTAIMGLLGFQFSGFLTSYKDMTENYSATLMMISGAISSIIGASVPFITGLIINDDSTDLSRWRTIFFNLINMYTLCNIAFLAFGTNKRQDWDLVTSHNKYKEGKYNHGMIDVNHVQMEEFTETRIIQQKNENETTF